MWKLFSLQGSYKWVGKLDDLVNEYNNTKHRTINMKPIDVNEKNEEFLIKNVYKNTQKIVKSKYKIGDFVRVSKFKTIFEKGYTPNWTTEIFQIRNVNIKSPVTYLLKDYKNQPIAGRFYEEEIKKTEYPSTYLVEKIIKKNNKKLFVKWLGFDNSHNSWIKAQDVI